MTIAFGNTTIGTLAFSNGRTMAVTVPAGTHMHAQVGIFCGEAQTVSGIPTLNGVNLNLLDSAANTGGGGIRVYMYGLVAPTTGNLIYALTGNESHGCFVINRSGVHQTNPNETPVKSITTTATPSVAVTSKANSLVVDCVGFATGTSRSLTVGALQTDRVSVNSGAGSSIGFGGSDEPGGASITMSWTISAAPDASAIIAMSLNPYIGGNQVIWMM